MFCMPQRHKVILAITFTRILSVPGCHIQSESKAYKTPEIRQLRINNLRLCINKLDAPVRDGENDVGYIRDIC